MAAVVMIMTNKSMTHQTGISHSPAGEGSIDIIVTQKAGARTVA